MPPLEPTSVLTAFASSNAQVQLAPSGFSGATVWKARAAEGTFALKAYGPEWDDAANLMSLHEWVARAGTELMPQPRRTRSGRSVVPSQTRLWELTDWRDGQPATELADVLPAVARLHHAWHSQRRTHSICPTVERQWVVLQVWPKRMTVTLDDHSLQPALDLLRSRLDAALAELQPWLARPLPLQVVHGDLWPGNVLVGNHRLSGIIDCASIRVDSVASDLARLCGPPSAAMNQLIAEQYEPIRPMQPVEWELLKTLSRTGPVARLAQWLQWLIIDHREFEHAEAAKSRFAEIVQQAHV